MKVIGILAVLMLLAVSPGSQAFAQQGPPPAGGGFIKHWDRDGDGRVTQDEFGGPADHFSQFDQNGDGVIDESEAPQGPPPRHGKGTPGPSMDQDQDGKISRQEFRGSQDLFNDLDANGDGFLDKSERPKGPPRNGRQGPPPLPRSGQFQETPGEPDQSQRGYHAQDRPYYRPMPPSRSGSMMPGGQLQGPTSGPGRDFREIAEWRSPRPPQGPPMMQNGPQAFGPPPMIGQGFPGPHGCPPGTYIIVMQAWPPPPAPDWESEPEPNDLPPEDGPSDTRF